MKSMTLLALALCALLAAGALYALSSGTTVDLADTALAAGAVQAPADAQAAGGSGCPRDILCLDVWDPVICDDGNVYSNSCYAYRACATGCEPLFGGPHI